LPLAGPGLLLYYTTLIFLPQPPSTGSSFHEGPGRKTHILPLEYKRPYIGDIGETLLNPGYWQLSAVQLEIHRMLGISFLLALVSVFSSAGRA